MIFNPIEYKELMKSDKSAYVNPDGTFKGGWDGCIQYFTEKKGFSMKSAEKMCGYIKARKGG